MSDFALTFLYVVPSANSVPTTGSTDVLTAGQTGIYLNTFAAATAGNIPDVPYIYIAQGRAEKSLPSFRSDKIAADKVIKWTKSVGSASALNEIWEVGNFNVPVGAQVTLTINAHSYYLDTAFNNGYTKSVTVTPACFECGDEPCETVDNEDVIDAILAELAKDPYAGIRTAGALTQFFNFQKIGSGNSAVLRITSKPITEAGTPCDLSANPYMFDRVWFRPFAYVGPETQADFQAPDKCEVAATTTLVQRSTYPKLTSAEVAQLEKDYYSYKVDRFKDLYTLQGYDPLFESYVESGVVYNQYLIDFVNQDNSIDSWNGPISKMVYRVLLFVPTSSSSSLEAILTAYLGTPETISGTSPTTTTTTSTSSTTTTTTTTLLP